MPSSTSTQRKIFLIYIPCHVDYERARENALKIRNQFAEIQDSRVGLVFDLRIIISVNGTNLSPKPLTDLTNSADEDLHLRYFVIF